MKYVALRRVNHDGSLYGIGAAIDMSEEQAQSLLDSGAIAPLPAVEEAKATASPQVEPVDHPVPTTEGPEPLNVNVASSVELQALEFIGPAIAKRILDKRPYASLDDVAAVAKLPAEQWEQIKDQLTV